MTTQELSLWDRLTHPGHDTAEEEALSSLTHCVGVALSVLALFVVSRVALSAATLDSATAVSPLERRRARLVVFVFVGSIIVSYGSSALYHATKALFMLGCIRRHEFLRLLDFSMIYLLIAGTITPFALITLRCHPKTNWAGWLLFLATWGVGVSGIVLNLFWNSLHERFSVGIYLAMGWMGVATLPLVLYYRLVPAAAVWLMLVGGVFYTVGAAVFVATWVPFNHSLWHLLSMVGTALHFVAIVLYGLRVEFLRLSSWKYWLTRQEAIRVEKVL